MPVAKQSFKYFKGNWLTSYRGIMLVAWTIMLSWLVVVMYTPEDIGGVIVWSMLFIPFFWVFGVPLYYFGVSAESFKIKHHLFFWWRKEYRFIDIEQILFDQSDSRSMAKNALRLTVVLKNNKTHQFQASTLRLRHWRALKKCILGKPVKLIDKIEFALVVPPKSRNFELRVIFYFLVYIIIALIFMTFISFSDASPIVVIILKLLWLVYVVAGIFVLRYLIVKLAKKQKEETLH
ncbi:MAG: hypothetical protein K0Q79_3564 [Flavipsychrobacter sp.]|nr:hypothetical protein [Flavipsychrobacter sp.]